MVSEKFTLRCAVHLVLIRDGQTLLLRRFNTGWMDGNYSVVAGHVEGNETIAAATAREAKEEACITIAEKNLSVIQTMHRKGTDAEYIDFFLTTHRWQGDIRIGEPHKCDALTWFPLDGLPENTIPYIRQAVQQSRNNVSFSEFGMSAAI